MTAPAYNWKRYWSPREGGFSFDSQGFLLPPAADAADLPPVFLHLGVYAYRRSALDAYVAAPVSDLEQIEGLEQLRFLDNGLAVAVVASEPLGWDPIELNNPSDVAVIEREFLRRGLN